ncbi:PTS fructose transporter subunit IIC [Listeria monocytogenes]
MKGKLNEAKDHLMSGISYALPVIIAGSLVVAVAKLIGIIGGVTNLDAYADASGFYHYVYLFQNVGWAAIGLLNLVLAGYIAYSIAGKPALAAGFVGGVLATSTNAGFLGAVVAGFFAGWLTNWVKKHVRITGPAASSLPLIILPLITVGATGILMSLILGGPLGWLNQTLLDWVTEMCKNDTNVIILALILGAMIGFDLGGPVNKAAWMAGNELFMSGIYLPSIMINVAICIPPLGYGIATLLRKKNYSTTFKEAGNGALIMGLIGVTEGAIPFTLRSPGKLIPLNVIACAIGSAVTMGLGAYVKMPPIGGMYGFFTIGNGWAYLVGGLVGAFIIGICANLFVNFTEEETAAADDAVDDIDISFDEIEIK